MAEQNDGTLVSAGIRPNSPLDDIYTVLAVEVCGGSHSYETLAERDAIFPSRRNWEMTAKVYNDPDPSLNGIYTLEYNKVDTVLTNNANWTLTGLLHGTDGVTITAGQGINISGSVVSLDVSFYNSTDEINLLGQGINITDSVGTGASLNTTNSSLSLSSTDVKFNDTRVVTKGIEYGDDYSADFTDNSLINKKYLTDTISGITAYSSGSGIKFISNAIALDITNYNSSSAGLTFTGELDISSADFVVTSGNGKGIRYAVDYSDNYVPRSLVDKAYVDGKFSTSGGGGGSGSLLHIEQTFTNVLTYTLTHSFGYKPVVLVLDNAGYELECQTYVNNSIVTISFNSLQSGLIVVTGSGSGSAGGGSSYINSVSSPLNVSAGNLSIPNASSTSWGLITAATFTVFNNKQDVLLAKAGTAGSTLVSVLGTISVDPASKTSFAVGTNINLAGISSVAIGSLLSATKNGAVALGYSSTATGLYSFSTSYAQALADFSVSIGIASQTANGALVSIGQSCVGNNTGAVTIGQNNNNNAVNGVIIGNNANSAVGADNSISLGTEVYATNYGSLNVSSGFSTGEGKNQLTFCNFYNTTNSSYQTRELFLDTSRTQRMKMPANSLWSITLVVQAFDTSNMGNSMSFKLEGLIKFSGGSCAWVGSTPTATSVGASLGWSIAVSLDSTFGYVSVMATGDSVQTVRWAGYSQIKQQTAS